MTHIDDTSYRNNHGAAPRGRGSWAFSTVDPDAPIGTVNYLDHLIRIEGTFSQARRMAALVVRRPDALVNRDGIYGVKFWGRSPSQIPSSAVRVAAGAAEDIVRAEIGIDILWVCP